MAFRFSVAWYPIYRIPEGNFRASFLTYHSLSQLVGKCIPIDSLNKKIFHIVFPVIGLQSYNTQVHLNSINSNVLMILCLNYTSTCGT